MRHGWRTSVVVALWASSVVACSPKRAHDDDDPSRSAGGSGGTTGTTSAGAGGAIGSCGTLTPTDVTRVVTTNLGNVLHDAVDTVSFAEGSALAGRAFAAGDAAKPLEFVADAHRTIDDWLAELTSKVFTSGNYVQQLEGAFVYQMRPETYCAADPDDTYPEDTYTDCERKLSRHRVGAVVEHLGCNDGDALAITPLFEANITRPLRLELYPTKLVAKLDFSELAAYATAYGFSGDYDSDSRGVVRVTLDTSTPARATLDVTLDDTLVYGAVTDGRHDRIELAASPAALHAVADGVSKRLDASLDLSTSSLTTSLAAFAQAAFGRRLVRGVPRSDSVVARAPRVTAQLAFDRVTDHANFTGILLDDAITVRHGADALVTAELNASAQRTFDVGVDLDAAGELRASVKPGFTLALDYQLNHVEDAIQDLQRFALLDRVTISLAGSAPVATALRGPTGLLGLVHRTRGAELRTDAGTLTLTSSEFPEDDVSVPAGQCLRFDPNRAGMHEVLRTYYAGACK